MSHPTAGFLPLKFLRREREGRCAARRLCSPAQRLVGYAGHGSCDGCVLARLLNARLHDGGPFGTRPTSGGCFTDGSVKLFASHRDAAPASVLSDITSAELDALAGRHRGGAAAPSA